MPSEKTLQQYIQKEAQKCGILVFKFASPSLRGVPDLLLILPNGETFYIEVKNPNGRGRLSTLQEVMLEKISDQGARVYVCASKDHADQIIRRELNHSSK